MSLIRTVSNPRKFHPLPRDRKSIILSSVIVTLVLVVGCRGSGDGPGTVVNEPSTIQPTAMPTSEVLPSPSPTVPSPTVPSPTVPSPTTVKPPVATVASSPDFNISAADVRIRSCSVATGGSGGSGTAPAPTPTPAPIESRAEASVQEDGELFLGLLSPLVRTLHLLDDEFTSSWSEASTESSQTALIFSFGTRLSYLCIALGQVSVPPEFTGSAALLGEAIRVRHAWALKALEELQCCGDARVAELNSGNVLTSGVIEDAQAAILDAAAQFEIEYPNTVTTRVSSQLLGIEFDLVPEQILVRNSIDLVVSVVPTRPVLHPKLLGPEAWRFGTAMRIRRIRNRDQLTPREAIEWHESALVGLGSIGPLSDRTFRGVDAVTFEIVEGDIGWTTSVTAFVRDGFTYFFEIGCGTDDAESCAGISVLASGIHFTSS